MFKKTLLSLFSTSLAGIIACQTGVPKDYQLKGYISQHPNTRVWLEQVEGAKLIVIDSAITDKEGQFFLKRKVPFKDFYRLKVSNNNLVFLILDPKTKTYFENKGSSLAENYLLEGDEEAKAVLKIKSLKNSLNQYRDSLVNGLKSVLPETQTARYAEAEKLYSEKHLKIVRTINQMCDQEPTLLALLTARELLVPDRDIQTLEKLTQKLGEAYPNSPHVQSIVLKLEQTQKTAIGAVAPEINLPDKDGNLIPLSSLRGKYVLIDFWASWCGPCRKENPNVVRIYEKYKSKGFDIYSVSLDKSKEAWLNAIVVDRLSWPSHVSDLAQWSSVVVPMYGIEGIPLTILLNPEGKIIAKGLRGEQLEEKLASLLP